MADILFVAKWLIIIVIVVVVGLALFAFAQGFLQGVQGDESKSSEDPPSDE